MKLIVQKHPDYTKQKLSGNAARAALREALTAIGESILIPEPPYTGIVRRRALDCLRRGEAICTDRNDLGRPVKGTIITMPIQIVGIIKADGTYEAVGEEPDKEE